MSKKKFVMVCPKCGSTDIGLPDLQPTDLNEAPAQFANARMLGARCKKCGFFSYSFPEFPEEKVREIQKKIRKKKG